MDKYLRVSAVCISFVFICLCDTGYGSPNTTLEYKICNGRILESAYLPMMHYVLDEAKDNVADHGYSYYSHAVDEYTDFNCWAHAACYGELSKLDCYACVIRAHNLLLRECEWNVGAQFQLKDCRVRRETYPFRED